MAIPSRWGVDKKINSMEGLSAYENGGKGSGNFGHSGRPGERGGSGSGKSGSSKGGREVSLKGMSVREKYEAIREGDEVHFIPKDNLPNFDRKIKVDFIRDGVPHYGLSETSDGHTYPFWAVKDIKKIIRKKNELELNGGKGSGNFGHSGRPGQVGGSGSGQGIRVHEGSKETDYYYAEDGNRVLASGRTEKEALEKAKKKLEEEARVDSSEIKGGTKAEKAKIKELLTSYGSYEERGMEGVIEDAISASVPGEDSTSLKKAMRLVEGGNFGVSYEDAFDDLKSIYGDNFKESTYKTKAGDWKYKDGEAYVWTTYKYKLAKAIADEMDDRETIAKQRQREKDLAYIFSR